MNILIVGNGFDLSHYLPTKYDHFMVAMGAIENWDKSKGDMGFDDIFGRDYWFKNDKTGEEWQNKFFQYTKAMYKTDEIKISIEKINELQKQLKENVWYQYFSDHVREVKTWIDFEQKIEEALNLVSHFIGLVHDRFLKFGKFNSTILKLEKFNSSLIDDNFYLSNLNSKLLIQLNLILKNIVDDESILGFINHRWLIVPKNLDYGYDADKYISFLNNQLNDFIEIFNIYLELVINHLIPNHKFSIESKEWINPDQIYSFNYTKTYQKLYDQSVETDYLHGSFGKEQNIVLGVSELEDDSLIKLKAFGFTKYHQKLFNETDYLFLDSYKLKVEQHKRKVEYFEKDFGGNDPTGKKFTRQNLMEVESKLNLNIFIWGHSLDVSDKEYILDLFSLNDDMDRNVKITVYYFDRPAKFALLNNLLAILEKDKVEQWMKKGWLKFESNPNIVELNNIQPVELPKIAEA